MGLAWLALAPGTADLAAHEFRAWLWDTEGFTVWNDRWYGGHHVPGYSLLFPPLAGALGARVAVVLAGVLAAAAVTFLTHTPRPGSVGQSPTQAGLDGLVGWLAAAGVAASLVVGRGPFLLGIAFGALALALTLRDRPAPAAAAALATVLASPVAGLFLLVAAVAVPIRTAATLALPTVIGGATLALLFPEGGEERFVATAFWPLLLAVLAVLALTRGAIRKAIAAYVVVLLVAFLFPQPVGQNAARLAVLAGPAVLLAFAPQRTRAVLVVCAGLVYLQWLPAYRAIAEATGDPSTEAAFYVPLLAHLPQDDRIEVVFTRNHWEAVHVAKHAPIGRGWERQLDIERNRLFYEPGLTPAEYERWLRKEQIRFVALPDAPLDFSARAEAEIISSMPPFLEPVWRNQDWRLFQVRGVRPQAWSRRTQGPGTLPMRHTRYWRVTAGRGCVQRAPGDRIEVTGALTLQAALSGPRCRR